MKVYRRHQENQTPESLPTVLNGERQERREAVLVGLDNRVEQLVHLRKTLQQIRLDSSARESEMAFEKCETYVLSKYPPETLDKVQRLEDAENKLDCLVETEPREKDERGAETKNADDDMEKAILLKEILELDEDNDVRFLFAFKRGLHNLRERNEEVRKWLAEKKLTQDNLEEWHWNEPLILSFSDEVRRNEIYSYTNTKIYVDKPSHIMRFFPHSFGIVGLVNEKFWSAIYPPRYGGGGADGFYNFEAEWGFVKVKEDDMSLPIEEIYRKYGGTITHEITHSIQHCLELAREYPYTSPKQLVRRLKNEVSSYKSHSDPSRMLSKMIIERYQPEAVVDRALRQCAVADLETEKERVGWEKSFENPKKFRVSPLGMFPTSYFLPGTIPLSEELKQISEMCHDVKDTSLTKHFAQLPDALLKVSADIMATLRKSMELASRIGDDAVLRVENLAWLLKPSKYYHIQEYLAWKYKEVFPDILWSYEISTMPGRKVTLEKLRQMVETIEASGSSRLTSIDKKQIREWLDSGLAMFSGCSSAAEIGIVSDKDVEDYSSLLARLAKAAQETGSEGDYFKMMTDIGYWRESFHYFMDRDSEHSNYAQGKQIPDDNPKAKST